MSNDNNDNNDDLLNRRINEALDDGVQQIDGETRLRLQLARQQALALQNLALKNKDKKHGSNRASLTPWIMTKWTMPFGGLTAAAIVLAFWMSNSDIKHTISNDTSLVSTQEEIISDEFWQEDPEMLDDIEFVAWLMDDELSPVGDNDESSEKGAG